MFTPAAFSFSGVLPLRFKRRAGFRQLAVFLPSGASVASASSSSSGSALRSRSLPAPAFGSNYSLQPTAFGVG